MEVDGVKKVKISVFLFRPQGFRLAAPWAGLHKKALRVEVPSALQMENPSGKKSYMDPYNQNQLYYTFITIQNMRFEQLK